jgi:hypothetical protein
MSQKAPLVAVWANGILYRDFRRLRLGVKVQVWLEAFRRVCHVIGAGEDHAPYLKLAGSFESVSSDSSRRLFSSADSSEMCGFADFLRGIL